MKVNFPSEAKGQLFIPGLNTLMFVGCLAVVLYFKESSKMEAAYGLAIIITMIATTILFANYLVLHRVKSIFIYTFLIVYLTIEIAFIITSAVNQIHIIYCQILTKYFCYNDKL